MASAAIQQVRNAPDGGLNVQIDGAFITYLKALMPGAAPSQDPAGFFIQAEQNGPAIFVAVDPSTITPMPQPGDQVSITITGKGMTNGQPWATSIDVANYTRQTTSNSVSALVQDISSTDAVLNLNNLDSEIITVTGTISNNFVGAGAGYSSAYLATTGNMPADGGLKLRVPSGLDFSMDLTSGCDVDVVGIPMWRFKNVAEPEAHTASEITIMSCPAPTVLSATAPTPSSVTVTFDRRIDPSTVSSAGTDFTFTSGLSATSAYADGGRQVTVATTTQSGGTTYVVTAGGSVHDFRGTAVSSTANTASFAGFVSPAVLRISEVNPNITGGRDLVELYVAQGGTVNGFKLADNGGTTLATLPNVLVGTGDVIVIHLTPGTNDVPQSETNDAGQYPRSQYSSAYDTAWDFRGGTSGMSYTYHVLEIRDFNGVTQDAVAFAFPGTQANGTYLPALAAIQDAGQWLPGDCGGSACTDAGMTDAIAVNWAGLAADAGSTVQRVGNADTNSKADWSPAGPGSMGSVNP